MTITADTAVVPLASNVLSVFAKASPDNFVNGMSWYDRAHNLACELSPDSPEIAAGVIAALSPLTPWNRNEALARKAFAEGGLIGGTMGASIAKVNAILSGVSPYEVMGSKSARKTKAFFETIAFPDRDDIAPVIDVHAFEIPINLPGAGANGSGMYGIISRKGNYDLWASTYIEAAQSEGIKPSQMQAITWLQWREMKGKDWNG